MCGRYASKLNERQLQRLGVEDGSEFQHYNIAPTEAVPIVRKHRTGRSCDLARWGLIPSWTKGINTKASTFNARSETIRQAPSFRDAWQSGRRCLFPAIGFYEWQAVAGQSHKQPWFIKSSSDELLMMAGLWEEHVSDSNTTLSATIITVPANALLTEIHQPKNRMPLVLQSNDWDRWLAGDQADTLIETAADDVLVAWPVSNYVNKVTHNDIRCMARSEPSPIPNQAQLF